jgi:hypothetical protein
MRTNVEQLRCQSIDIDGTVLCNAGGEIMNWIEVVILGSFIVILIAIARGRKRRGASCCGEGMDNDGYDINRKEKS